MLTLLFLCLVINSCYKFTSVTSSGLVESVLLRPVIDRGCPHSGMVGSDEMQLCDADLADCRTFSRTEPPNDSDQSSEEAAGNICKLCPLCSCKDDTSMSQETSGDTNNNNNANNIQNCCCRFCKMKQNENSYQMLPLCTKAPCCVKCIQQVCPKCGGTTTTTTAMMQPETQMSPMYPMMTHDQMSFGPMVPPVTESLITQPWLRTVIVTVLVQPTTEPVHHPDTTDTSTAVPVTTATSSPSTSSTSKDTPSTTSTTMRTATTMYPLFSASSDETSTVATTDNLEDEAKLKRILVKLLSQREHSYTTSSYFVKSRKKFPEPANYVYPQYNYPVNPEPQQQQIISYNPWGSASGSWAKMLNTWNARPSLKRHLVPEKMVRYKRLSTGFDEYPRIGYSNQVIYQVPPWYQDFDRQMPMFKQKLQVPKRVSQNKTK